MQQRSARVIVQVLAIAIWALTFIITVVTLNGLVNWQFFTPQGVNTLTQTPIVAAFVNMLLVIVFGTAIGWGLWHRFKWGRVLAIVFLCLVMLDIIVHLFWMTLTFGWLLLLVACIGLIYLLCKGDVRQLFR